MTIILTGIFLTSENPEAVARFYREVACLPIEEIRHESYVYWKADQNGLHIAIHDAGKFSNYTYPANTQSNLTHLYFKIANSEEFLSHLEKMNIKPYCQDEVVITVLDPDGRKVMFGIA